MSFKSWFKSRESQFNRQVAVSSKSEVRQCWTIVWQMMSVEMARTTIECCVCWCASRSAGSFTAEMTSAESFRYPVRGRIMTPLSTKNLLVARLPRFTYLPYNLLIIGCELSFFGATLQFRFASYAQFFVAFVLTAVPPREQSGIA